MLIERLASNKIIDNLLGGGIEKGSITNFYGPAGSGKTNLALLFTLSCIKDGKVVYIDTENGFSTERFFQIGGKKDDLRKIYYHNPKTFREQTKIIQKLKKLDVNLVVVDSMVTLYRLEINKDNFTDINRELAKQLLILSIIAKEKNIPIIITNQVYSINSEEIELSGRDIVKYWSKCLVELKKLDNNKRIAILRKHRSLPEEKKLEFQITENGIEKPKFRIF
ncbi:MAG TPA: DNA repair and recombination protein RadB [Candidatus Aenigmarchaeota archaeon]|nr:DNA repair and recombination protein RadB [Candidatus Aenigmarchaeota archaeon]